jgi:hypothetical protein
MTPFANPRLDRPRRRPQLARAAAMLLLAIGLAAGSADAQQKAAPESRPHVLEGAWKVYWLDQDKVTEMQISNAFAGQGVTNLMGAMVLLNGISCPLTGNVVDTMEATYKDGPERKTIDVSAFVTLKVQCETRVMWIETMGLPSGPFLMVGRATQIGANGERAMGALALGR